MTYLEKLYGALKKTDEKAELKSYIEQNLLNHSSFSILNLSSLCKISNPNFAYNFLHQGTIFALTLNHNSTYLNLIKLKKLKERGATILLLQKISLLDDETLGAFIEASHMLNLRIFIEIEDHLENLLTLQSLYGIDGAYLLGDEENESVKKMAWQLKKIDPSFMIFSHSKNSEEMQNLYQFGFNGLLGPTMKQLESFDQKELYKLLLHSHEVPVYRFVGPTQKIPEIKFFIALSYFLPNHLTFIEEQFLQEMTHEEFKQLKQIKEAVNHFSLRFLRPLCASQSSVCYAYEHGDSGYFIIFHLSLSKKRVSYDLEKFFFPTPAKVIFSTNFPFNQPLQLMGGELTIEMESQEIKIIRFGE